MAMIGLYSKDTDGQMYTSSSKEEYILLITEIIKVNNLGSWKHKSKSVYDYMEKNNLLFCDMNTHEARKATCEKVRVLATVTDRNLWISQGTM